MTVDKKIYEKEILGAINANFIKHYVVDKTPPFNSLTDWVMISSGYGKFSPLKWVLESGELIFNKEEMDYLIKNSDLKLDFENGETILGVAIRCSRKITLDEEQWNYLIINSGGDREIGGVSSNLLNALTIPNYLKNFNNSNWINLIKKTDDKYVRTFSVVILSTMLKRIPHLINIPEVANLLLTKLDPVKMTPQTSKDLLYVGLMGEQFDFSLRFAEMAGLRVVRKTLSLLNKDIEMKNEKAIDGLNKIIEIMETKKKIEKVGGDEARRAVGRKI